MWVRWRIETERVEGKKNGDQLGSGQMFIFQLVLKHCCSLPAVEGRRHNMLDKLASSLSVQNLIVEIWSPGNWK